LFLKEVPLRKTVETAGLGESFAMPKDDDSLHEVERAISGLALHLDRRAMYERMAARAGVALEPAAYRILSHIALCGPLARSELAVKMHLDPAGLRDCEQQLIKAEFIVDVEGRLAPTALGCQVVERFVAARREALADLLRDWSPQEHAELVAVLDRLARDLVSHQEGTSPRAA